MNNTDKKENGVLAKELTPRQLGVFILLIIFPIAFYFACIKPLSGQVDHASFKWILLMMFSLLLGGSYTCFPKSAEKILGSWKVKPQPLGWVIWLITFIAVFGAYIGLNIYLQ